MNICWELSIFTSCIDQRDVIVSWFCLQVESVELALKILDGYEVRGNKIHVERAKFTMKGNFDPSKKRKKLTNKEKKRLKEKQQK